MNSFRDGIVGFFLFFAHWLSPETEKAAIDINLGKLNTPSSVTCKCKLDIAWNKQLEQLVDAGIPLHFRIRYFTDKSDTIDLYRTLHYKLIDYTYSYTDSVASTKKLSKSYPLIDLVLRDFCRWQFEIPKNASFCKVEAEILPSRAERFDRYVDMSRVWGQQKVIVSFNPKENSKKK
jgi:hypothetical protein